MASVAPGGNKKPDRGAGIDKDSVGDTKRSTGDAGVPAERMEPKRSTGDAGVR